MNGEPTQRELYDAVLKLQGAMLHGFNSLDRRMSKLETRIDRLEIRMTLFETRMTGLENRIHEFDEDFQTFRIEVTRRFDRVDGRLANLEAA